MFNISINGNVCYNKNGGGLYLNSCSDIALHNINLKYNDGL